MEKPGGPVTFLFTDIEGSTRHLLELGEEYVVVLEDHHRLMRAAIADHDGFEVDTEGDAFFVAFQSASNAVAAAVAVQLAFCGHGWLGAPVKVRMGIHTGVATPTSTGYVGIAVHLAARICAAAHGGQILISAATRAQLDELPLGSAVASLGRHRLKDIADPQLLFQVCHPGLEEVFPPLRTLGSDADAIPAPPTEVIGRAEEVAALVHILLNQHSRLVTLTGPGGVGKTTLAIQAAHACANHFDDGVFFVPLAPVERAELVGPAIGLALHLKEQTGQVADLQQMLHRRRALLVLDNFEHLMAAAPLVADLVASCPRLVILATSREVLRVRGEREHDVLTLPVPLPDADQTLEEVRSSAAVRLLEARARDVNPAFEVNAENASAVARICQQLDGLPLAIELAAARLKILPPDALLERLANRLGLLKGGSRDRPKRQQTLRAAVQWSYDLLDPEERKLFRQLSVFAGGCSLEAAQAVCDSSGDVLDGVASLVDKSLLRRVSEHQARFTMLETLREYATSALAEHDEVEGTRQRHASYYASLGEQAEPMLTSADRDQWIARLRTELENLRAALGWLRENDEEGALRLAGNLSWFWYYQGLFREGRMWLEQGGNPTAVSPRVRARALLGAARLAGYSGDQEAAEQSIDEVLELSRRYDDDAHLAYALHFSGVLFAQNHPERAASALREAASIFRELDDRWGLALALCYDGIVAFSVNNRERMEMSLDESSQLFEDLDDAWGLAGAVLYRGLYHHQRGDLDTAKTLLEQCESLLRRTGDRWRLATLLGKLAEVRSQLEQDPNPLLEERRALLEDLGVVEAE